MFGLERHVNKIEIEQISLFSQPTFIHSMSSPSAPPKADTYFALELMGENGEAMTSRRWTGRQKESASGEHISTISDAAMINNHCLANLKKA